MQCMYCCSFSKHLAFSRHLYLLDGRHLAAYKPLTGQQCRPDPLNCMLLIATARTYIIMSEKAKEMFIVIVETGCWAMRKQRM